MRKLYTIPSGEEVARIASQVPISMVPSTMPHACVAEGVLSKETCDAIIDEMTWREPYRFHGCAATTRELDSPFPRSFFPVEEFAKQANAAFWQFRVNNTPTAWMQTYGPGEGYQLHSDAMIGASRKFTVVALLSDELDYDGGILRVMPYPEYYAIPKTQGTLVAFPAWMWHDVTEVTGGGRCSLNVGYYGPPFM